MRTKGPLLGFPAIVAVGLAVACSDSPIGVERFDPQFEFIIDDPVSDPNTLRYTFDDLPGTDHVDFCTGSDGVYEGLVFSGWGLVGGCSFGLG